MRIRHLVYYVALSQEEHFGRAARACGVTQSTLSTAIRQLENEIGAPLIERDKRFKGFTVEGKVLLDWARRIISDRKNLDQKIGSLRGELKGDLSIGVIPTALPATGLLTAPTNRLYPNVSFQILSRTSNEIQQMLDNFVLDIGVTYLDNEPLHGVKTYKLYEEHYILLTPEEGPFKGRKNITWKEVGDTPLCLLTPDMQNRRILNAIFASVGCSPNTRAETNSVMTLYSHIRTGVWSSVLPENFLWVFGKPPGMIALPLIKPERSLSIGMVVRNQDPLPPLVEAFVGVVIASDIEARLGSGAIVSR